MVQLYNSTAITLAAGATLIFDKASINTRRCTCWSQQTGSVKMTSRGIYDVRFAGNITGATAGTPVQLSITLGGVALPEGLMISTPSAANAFENVAKSIYISNCCGDFSRIAITNTGTSAVTIGVGATLSVRKAMS